MAGLLVLKLHDQSPRYYMGGSLLFAFLAAGVIWGVEVRPSCLLAQILSWEPFRLVGLISYGMYLWHSPVDLWIQLPNQPSTVVNLTKLMVTIGLATTSYIIVEKPLRHVGACV